MIRLLLSTLVLGFIAIAPPALADVFKLEPRHTCVTFSYNHFGLTHPTGKIMGATGSVTFDASRPAESAVDVSLEMATLSTGLPMFDKQLQGADYFDVARYPTAMFKSTAVEVTGDNTANVTGDLTLHGVTKSVVLSVIFNKQAFNPVLFKTGIGFSATTRISRKDFGVEKYEPFVGDDIDLRIEAEAYP
jgi:polyisoprenoid-binding protein YceI